MKRGDISNTTAPTVLVRVEDTLLTVTHKTFMGFNIKENIEVNENTFILLKRLSMHSPYRVELVTDCKNHSKFNEILEELDIPFARIHRYSEQTITNFLNCGIYFCYIDDNSDRIGRANHKSCYTVVDFSNLVL